jgi:hypothetical protein
MQDMRQSIAELVAVAVLLLLLRATVQAGLCRRAHRRAGRRLPRRLVAAASPDGRGGAPAGSHPRVTASGFRIAVLHNQQRHVERYEPGHQLTGVCELFITADGQDDGQDDGPSLHRALELAWAVSGGAEESSVPPRHHRAVAAYRARGLRATRTGDVFVVTDHRQASSGAERTAWAAAQAGGVEQLGQVPAHTPLARRQVVVPGRDEHGGQWSAAVELEWTCPRCGEPRGEPFSTFSDDDGQRLLVHGWGNPCGHADFYWAVRAEVQAGRGALVA